MLELIRRVGQEFGISVLVSSHLLGEIERICDHVIVIDAGRLLRSSAIDALTERRQLLAVEVLEGTDELAKRLAEAGIETLRDHRLLLVELDEDRTYEAIRDAVADLGLALVRLEQRRHSIEDIFRTAVPSPLPPHEIHGSRGDPGFPGEGQGGG